MKQVSNKRARLNRAVKPARDSYKELFPMCQWCGAETNVATHEISRGAGRSSSLGVRAALLNLCLTCHRIMDWMPVAGQLAIKKIVDPEGYDRATVCRLRGRAETDITESEVERWVSRFQLQGTSYAAQ